MMSKVKHLRMHNVLNSGIWGYNRRRETRQLKTVPAPCPKRSVWCCNKNVKLTLLTFLLWQAAISKKKFNSICQKISWRNANKNCRSSKNWSNFDWIGSVKVGERVWSIFFFYFLQERVKFVSPSGGTARIGRPSAGRDMGGFIFCGRRWDWLNFLWE